MNWVFSDPKAQVKAQHASSSSSSYRSLKYTASCFVQRIPIPICSTVFTLRFAEMILLIFTNKIIYTPVKIIIYICVKNYNNYVFFKGNNYLKTYDVKFNWLIILNRQYMSFFFYIKYY